MNKCILDKEKLELKGRGILPQKQEGYFAIRFISKAGYFNTDEMTALTNIAKEYGNGNIGLTSRLTIEIPYIKYENLEKVLKEAKSNGLVVGGGGPTVRAILTCKGTVCTHGLIDTNHIALEIEERFFGKKLPHKFKIAVLGCNNSYGKAQVNDIGILPIKKVHILEENCILCDKCVKFCKYDGMKKENNKIVISNEKCISCGKCIKVCPTKAIEGEEIEFLIFLGGRLGRKARLATPINKSFKREEIINAVDKIIKYFESQANKNERFADVIERIGLKSVEEEILNSL
ncbi:4Fe-4S binding protein [Clostridium fallax]|uniref:Dissimilatory sulfite reductase (Desulfoviridin), alpha and beta subunits n=1 Tax=Clostridium fallax TaxID=1533 RepID=A0A1M4SK41_9CLOT|nr:4Fe-4S binding protein [Clostridium fallax]SHE32528.1 Dissimilatory sulfite reductase (desulfoviridin), alpha and beta subunits [Clostridium fallax]SQB07863.1 sulfite/nitrite reductase family protein [Clostridium fallax]